MQLKHLIPAFRVAYPEMPIRFICRLSSSINRPFASGTPRWLSPVFPHYTLHADNTFQSPSHPEHPIRKQSFCSHKSNEKMTHIGILVGSARQKGNADGLSRWLLSLCTKLAGAVGSNPKAGPAFETILIDPSSPIYPSGPLKEPEMPAGIRFTQEYSSPSTRAFSELVKSCDALIILSPQYNWGYPGCLKNALDHLYFEWRDKPFGLIMYGGHGGSKAAEQLTAVLEGGLKAKVVSKVLITLPSDYIREDRRVGAADDGFLAEYEDKVMEAVRNLKNAVVPR